MTKYYTTRIIIDVLSEGPLELDLSGPDDLDTLRYEITEGGWVGHINVEEGQEISGKEMADKLYEFGSEPEFFQLNDDGTSMEEEND